MTSTGRKTGGRTASDRARREQLMADAAGLPAARELPVWLPRSIETASLPAGVWWDAVTATGPLARRVMLALGSGTGAVIEDRREDVLHWLVRPGAADGWPVPPGVTVRGPGYALTVPPVHRTHGPGLFWRVPPTRDGHLTDPAALLAALRSAMGETG